MVSKLTLGDGVAQGSLVDENGLALDEGSREVSLDRAVDECRSGLPRSGDRGPGPDIEQSRSLTACMEGLRPAHGLAFLGLTLSFCRAEGTPAYQFQNTQQLLIEVHDTDAAGVVSSQAAISKANTLV